MSRRRRSEKRLVDPDPIYNSHLVAKFINKAMWDGKKSLVRKIVYNAIDRFAKKVESGDPLAAFEQALENAKPSLEVRSRRIGGATYQVPMEIPSLRRTSMAIKWVIHFSRERKGCSTEEGLVRELIDCFNRQGASVKKKDDMHKMAESNKAFAHYKW